MDGRYAGKSKWLAVTLAFFFGIFGAHKFYLGDRKVGVLYLVFFWTTIPLYLGIIDAIILAAKSNEEFAGFETKLGLQGKSGFSSFDGTMSSPAPLWKSKGFLAASGIFVLFLGIVLFAPIPESNRSSSTSAPASSGAAQSVQQSGAENRACRAMLSADKAVATVGRKLTSGQTVSNSEINSIRSALTSVNGAYKDLEGSFYWYLVAQGNALDSLDRALRSNDQRAANTALRSYLNNDDYSLYCR